MHIVKLLNECYHTFDCNNKRGSERMTKNIVIVLMVFLAFLLVMDALDIDLVNEDSPEDLDVVVEACNIIHEEYVDRDELDDEQLIQGALEGLVNAVDDPYTLYLGPEESEISNSDMEGDFSGIGATLTKKDGELTVVAPISDSPAEIAGIEPGDVILSVDGKSTSDMNLIEAVLQIRGPEGTKVILEVLHSDEDTPVEIEITRSRIEVPSVKWEMLDGKIAHVTITNFSNRTGEELISILDEVETQGGDGIVLDLRNNPGGLVDAAVDVVSQFVNDGVVVYALDSDEQKDEWDVISGGVALDIPMAVLVNENSASASEVVAGALQDYKRAKIIGVTIYGKGKMGLVNTLSNDGSLYVTYARWYTPNGRQIDDVGIDPDIEVEVPSSEDEVDTDVQLQVASEYVRQQF